MTTQEKIKAQNDYCLEKHIPRFAPLDGHCYHCQNQIYNKISDKKASQELIVSCPYCNVSFC